MSKNFSKRRILLSQMGEKKESLKIRWPPDSETYVTGLK
jgi:hypothetical protein